LLIKWTMIHVNLRLVKFNDNCLCYVVFECYLEITSKQLKDRILS